MKTLTLTQPWASLVAIGAKRIETRSWGTNYRGPLAIHAAKGFPAEAARFSLGPDCFDLLFATGAGVVRQGSTYGFDLPRGAMVAIVTLVNCVRIVGPYEDIYRRTYAAEHEQSFGDYTPGRFAWVFTDVQRLPEPIPARGSLGLWDWHVSPNLLALLPLSDRGR